DFHVTGVQTCALPIFLLLLQATINVFASCTSIRIFVFMSVLINRSLVVAVISVLLAMITIQSGASIAKQLFPLIGPEGTTALRLGFSALVLWLVFRPWRAMPQGRDWQAIVIYGLCLGGMNLLFY